MNDVVAIRMTDEFLEKLEKLGKEEATDRSSLVRSLIEKGYVELIKEKAAQTYREGKITLTEAAHRAGLTLFEMMKYLVDKGFKSEYSIEDLEKEIA